MLFTLAQQGLSYERATLSDDTISCLPYGRLRGFVRTFVVSQYKSVVENTGSSNVSLDFYTLCHIDDKLLIRRSAYLIIIRERIITM